MAWQPTTIDEWALPVQLQAPGEIPGYTKDWGAQQHTTACITLKKHEVRQRLKPGYGWQYGHSYSYLK